MSLSRSSSLAVHVLLFSFAGLAPVLAGCRSHPLDPANFAAAFRAGAGYRSPLGADVDADRDGLKDDLELALAIRHAPVVTLHEDDRARPASVEWLASRAGVDLVHGDPADVQKALRNLSDDARRGSPHPSDWVTYVHVYPSREPGGVLVQYWFFYPHNDGPLWFDHESDWEHITVVLDANRAPRGVYAARHSDNAPGAWRAWEDLRTRDHTHPILLSAKGTHASYFDERDVGWQDVAGQCDGPGACGHVQWETWRAGGLRNMGERLAPMDLHALRYRGLWGASRILPGTSAPVGPAYQRGWCTNGIVACGVLF